MDSQQTSRTPEDPVGGRGNPMVKQNQSLPPGFQARPQGPPPRFPINNGSVGGPRIGQQQQQPPTLHRLDSRSSINLPTGPGAGQFLHQRPPFGPPRPQNPAGNPNQGPRPLPPSNPQGLQGPPQRHPIIPGSPGIRPPLPNNFVGQRPPIYNANQPQQIYYQPRNGETRPPRPLNADPGTNPHIGPGPNPQIRYPPFPHNPEARQPHPQIIPDTLVTPPPPRNDAQLRDTRVNNQPTASGGPITDRRSQPLTRQGPGLPRGKMEVIESRSSTPGNQMADSNQGNGLVDNDNLAKRKPSPRGENDDDDDDVVMDSENDRSSKSPMPDAKSSVTLQPEVAKIDSPISGGSTGPASPANSYKISGSPSPIPPIEESPGANISKTSSPVPPSEKSGEASRSASRLGSAKNSEVSGDEDSKSIGGSQSNLHAGDAEDNNDLILEKRNESRASSVQSSRSPVPSRTPEPQATLSVPGSATPKSPNSPKSPKSPVGSVKGFDNGQIRSLSPKSPTPSVSPASTDSPNLPEEPKSAEDDKNDATSGQNEEAEGEGEKEEEAEVVEDGNDAGNFETRPMTPAGEARGKPPPTPSKLSERAQTPGTPDGRKSFMKRSTSGRSIKSDAGSDSGANQSNQGAPTTNGVSVSPTKKIPIKTSREGDKRSTAASPVKSPSKSVKSLPRTPDAGPPPTAEKKKVPMNKVQVGAAPSPNLKTVRSKIGSLDNASYKPGGGKVKIENRKLDFSKAQPKIAAKNDKYTPSGGDKKITQIKLQWNAKPKVGSLDNATYKPGGGDKKIESVKLDFKDKAKPKVGSKDNAKHVPGGGTVKSSATPPKTPQDPPNDIETQKLDIKAESKIGSLDNMKHKPGGGDKKIFNDRDYLRQTGSAVESCNGSGTQSPVPSHAISDGKNGLMPTSDENLNEEC